MLYENMDVWKRSRLLSIAVYRDLRNLKDFGFKDQITRSVLSVPSNIAEGFERKSTNEKVRFLDFSKGSLGEFKTKTDIGVEIGYINKDIGYHWMDEAEQLSKMIAALMNTLKKY